MINAEEFMQQTSEEALDTIVIPCPPGEWNAQISKLEAKEFEYKSGDRIGEKGLRLALSWSIMDDEPKQHCGRDIVTVNQSILLDLTPEGGLDMGKGKNIQLGRLREAVGQNVAGQPWGPVMLDGQVAKLVIEAGVYNDNPTAEVRGVRAA